MQSQRFARADKRAKLPKWINQYIAETATNLSTDMAIGMSFPLPYARLWRSC